VDWARLEASAAHAHQVAARTEPVWWQCPDADVVVLAASLVDEWSASVGLWLEVSPGRPAQLCARDVATLSHIVNVASVVVSNSEDASAYARVVAALLTNDEVTLSSPVAELRGAYNRPAPPRAIDVWSFDGKVLRRGDEVRHAAGRRKVPEGVLTTFA